MSAHQRCILPPHAQRICQIGVPCAFECQENYTEKDGKCACLLPFRDCNGVCDYFPDVRARIPTPVQTFYYLQGCGTASPILARHKRQAISITTLVQAKHTCDINESVCGIPGREDTLDFECVDTSKTLDSCVYRICIVIHHSPYAHIWANRWRLCDSSPFLRGVPHHSKGCGMRSSAWCHHC